MLTDESLRMLVFYTIVVKMSLNLRQKIKGSAKTPLALLTCRSPQEAGVWGRVTLPTAGGGPWDEGCPSEGLPALESLLDLHGPRPQAAQLSPGICDSGASFVVRSQKRLPWWLRG